MSEKLDGIRGFWDGKQLLTRGGKRVMAPDWFIENYPPFAIDGELWTKRADFEGISSIVRRKNPDERWRKITHQIFEVPNQQGGLLDRLAVLRDYLKMRVDSPIKIIKQYPINQRHQVKRFLQNIVRKGGEGVVVRNPNTAYQTGRLSSALKVKQYLDTECVIEKILPGKGKYTGKMGALLCKTKKGVLVKIGSGFKDIQRENPPPIGTTITFKYFGLTKKGKPKYPVFLRIRLVR
jgi:DNA ligase-1